MVNLTCANASKNASMTLILFGLGLFCFDVVGSTSSRCVSAFTFFSHSKETAKLGPSQPFLSYQSTLPCYAQSSNRSYKSSSFTSKKTKAYPGSTKSHHNRSAQSSHGNKRKKQNRPNSLNNELNRLRWKENGIPQAERRLEDAIDRMVLQQDGHADLASLLSEVSQVPGNIDNTTLRQQLLMLPNEVSFNVIISSLARSAQRDWTAPQRAEQLLQKMKELSNTFPHLQPTIFTYNAVMEAYAKSASSRFNQKRTQQHKQSLLRLFEEVNENLSPNSYTYNLILTLKNPLTRAWQRAEEWAMAHLEKKNLEDFKPDRQSYNHLLSTYAEVGDADKAEHLLKDLLKYCEDEGNVQLEDDGGEDQTHYLKPNRVWFNCVLKALAKGCSLAPVGDDTFLLSFGHRADALLKQMKSISDARDSSLQPDTITYNHLLNVHAQCGQTEPVERILYELEQSQAASIDHSKPMTDRITYTTAIKSFAVKQKQRDSAIDEKRATEIAQKATGIFQRMLDLSDAGHPKMSPSIVTYNIMISIWAYVGTRIGMNRATGLLRSMLDQKILPDSVSYTTLIHGWSKAVQQQGRLPEAGYRSEKLLHELEQLPSTRQRQGIFYTTVYNSVITAWAKSDDRKVAPQRVESLLSQLERKFLNGQEEACPDKTTFLCVIDAYAKARVKDAEERCDALLQRMRYLKDDYQLDGLEPDRSLYNSVLNALAKSCQPSATEKAEEILTLMQTSPEESLRPDIVTYSTVIDCYTKCGGRAALRAEELLRFVEGSYRNGDVLLKPNAVFYSGILQAWAKTATPEGAQKAEDFLRRNLGLYEEGYEYAKPHAIMYNAVMDAIARTGEAESGPRAEELLTEMESLYEAGNTEMKPTRRSFNAVMLAYRKNGDGGQKAEELLRRMEELADSGARDVTPDVVSYNCVIGAIVDDENMEGAADRAQALLDRMEERSVQPDGRTYSCVIEAWLKRHDEKGHALAEMMLRQFLDKVESNKNSRNRLYEDAVWDVINAYRTGPDDMTSLSRNGEVGT